MSDPESLLKKWSHEEEKYAPLTRANSSYNPLNSYILPTGGEKGYMQQFGDMYFLRLAKLKPVAESAAEEAWNDFEMAGEKATRVDRVLDVRQGQLCWVAGTIFMELSLKPNILDDISREHWIARPPPCKTYYAEDEDPRVMLEDESGRLRLTGPMLKTILLVTGVIVAVLGTENADGEFEVLEFQVAELPRQPERWERDLGERSEDKMEVDPPAAGKKIVFVSSLDISGTQADSMNLSLLSEFLLGEALGLEEQASATSISRLVIAGNSIASDVITTPPADDNGLGPKKATQKKYGYDASAYNPTPTAVLDAYLSELLPSIPITLMPGEHDPANISLPQQPTHPAMFPHARAYGPQGTSGVEPGWFDSVTNPWEGDIEGWRVMGNSGQPVDDVLKYLDLSGPDGHGDDGRLEVMEAMLRWRCGAPTAPDTLWCYPFQDKDQFVIEDCPHVFFVGNQPKFETSTIEGPSGQQVRLISIPKFHETGQIVVVDSETLEAEVVKIEIHDEARNGA